MQRHNVAPTAWCYSIFDAVSQQLTELQLMVGLAQAPVHVAVAVSLLEQVVQNFPDSLPLVDHQRLSAAVVQQKLHHQLSQRNVILLYFAVFFRNKQ